MAKALVIVAHPDDETLWMGAYILAHKDWDWHIISLCRSNDKDRAPKFNKVCTYLGAKSIISDLEDEKLNPLPINFVTQKIKELLSLNNFDYIFTHGKNGEYGHIRHKEVHKAVKQLVKAKVLNCKRVFYFSYSINGNSYKKGDNANKIIKIPKKLKTMKKRLIQNIYGFEIDAFESKFCNMQQESFLVNKM